MNVERAPMTTPLLKITNLHAEAGGNRILNGLDLEIGSGEVHAVMGPNLSMRSTSSSWFARS